MFAFPLHLPKPCPREPLHALHGQWRAAILDEALTQLRCS